MAGIGMGYLIGGQGDLKAVERILLGVVVGFVGGILVGIIIGFNIPLSESKLIIAVIACLAGYYLVKH